MTTLPSVKLDRGIHVMHLFYRIDRECWAKLPKGEAAQVRYRLETLCATNTAPSHPRLVTYANVGGKADIAFMLFAADLGHLGQMHRDLEACFPPGALQKVYSYLSVTELTDYMSTDEDNRRLLTEQEKLQPGTEAYDKRLAELTKRKEEYEQYRLYPELPDWLLNGKYGAGTHYAEASNVGLNPCHHCGTVGSALTVWDPSKVEGCTCPCHTVRRPKLASAPRKQAALKSKRPLRNTRKELRSNAQE